MKKLLLFLVLVAPAFGQTFSGTAGSDIFIPSPFRFCMGVDTHGDDCATQSNNQEMQWTGSVDFKWAFRKVATLPAASILNQGRTYEVTDGQSTTDCTTGGGSSIAICTSDGTQWNAIGASGNNGGSGGVPSTLPNCTAAPTTLSEGVQLSTQIVNSVAQLCGTTASASSTTVVGVCTSGCGASGNAAIAYSGYANAIFDGQTVQGDYAIPSSTAGQFTDIGASKPSGTTEVVGIVAGTNTGAGTAANILIQPLSLYTPGGSNNSGNINNASQYQVPYYSNSGSSNVLSGFSACTVNTSTGLFDCTLLGTNGVGTGTITLLNGSAPSNPASGNSTLYVNSTSGFLSCLNSGGGSCLSASASNGISVGDYTVYPTSSTCATYSASGTTYCALNNSTGNIDYTGSDAGVVVNAAINNILTTCGTLYFKNGIYNINSLTQESTGGFSNYYGIALPGEVNVSSKQFCSWHLIGEQYTTVVGSSFSSPPVQTQGVILNVTSTAVSSVTSTSKIVAVWARPDTSAAQVGPAVFLQNIDVRFPSNQRGCETAVDLTNGIVGSYENVNTDTAVAPGSLVFPVEASCTSWGGSDRGGLLGVTTTISSKQSNYMYNVNAWGCDECIDVRAEHTVLVNTYANSGNYGIEYGVNGGASSKIYHPSTFLSSGWSECARGLTIGSNVQSGATLDSWGTDVEEATSGSFVPVYRASEAVPGNLYGTFTYSVVDQGVGDINLPVPSLFDGNAGGLNIIQRASGINSYVTPAVAVADSFTRANTSAGSLGTASYLNDTTMLISSDKAALQAGAGGGRAIYKGANFTADQYAKITVSTMDSSSSTFAQVEVNNQGVLGGSHQEYEYFCSKGAGANQYGIAKHVSSTETYLSTSSSATCPSTPFTLELRNQNGMICAYLNGKPDFNIPQNCVADTALTGGYPAFDLVQDATNGVAVSAFSGGNLPALHNGDSIFGQPGAFDSLEQFTLFGTTTNCAAVGSGASPSVAACGAAAAGSYSCATNASGATCVVDTTAVTANSEIFITQRTDTTTGTRLGVTCNTGVSTVIPVVTAVTAATSFTINLGTINTNPECFSYHIVN